MFDLDRPLTDDIFEHSFLRRGEDGVLRLYQSPADQSPHRVDVQPCPCKTEFDRMVRGVALQRRYALPNRAQAEGREVTVYESVLGAGYIGLEPVTLVDDQLVTQQTERVGSFAVDYRPEAMARVRRLVGQDDEPRVGKVGSDEPCGTSTTTSGDREGRKLHCNRATRAGPEKKRRARCDQ